MSQVLSRHLWLYILFTSETINGCNLFALYVIKAKYFNLCLVKFSCQILEIMYLSMADMHLFKLLRQLQNDA